MSKRRSDMECVFDPASFDNEPLEVPVHLLRNRSERDEMLALIQFKLSEAAEGQGEESFEEADDFDVMDDNDMPFSPHELTAMQEEFIMHPERFARKENGDGSTGSGSVADGVSKGGVGPVGEVAGKKDGQSGNLKSDPIGVSGGTRSGSSGDR